MNNKIIQIKYLRYLLIKKKIKLIIEKPLVYKIKMGKILFNVMYQKLSV